MAFDDDVIKRPATAKDWDKVRALYLRGETMDYICKALPMVNLDTKKILKKMGCEGLTAKKIALNQKVADHALGLIEEDKLRTNSTCINLFNTGAEVIEKLLSEYTNELDKGGVSKGQARATAYNVDMLMSGVTKIQKGLRVAYGMDENGKLHETEPEVLVIEGLNTDKI